MFTGTRIDLWINKNFQKITPTYDNTWLALLCGISINYSIFPTNSWMFILVAKISICFGNLPKNSYKYHTIKIIEWESFVWPFHIHLLFHTHKQGHKFEQFIILSVWRLYIKYPHCLREGSFHLSDQLEHSILFIAWLQLRFSELLTVHLFPAEEPHVVIHTPSQ